MAKVIFLIFISFASPYLSEQAKFISRDYIDKINKEVTTWEAGENFDPNTPEEELLKLLGTKNPELNSRNIHENPPIKTNDTKWVSNDKIYKEFDASKNWPNCKTITDIRDQGRCPSCWAFSSTGAFADRMCVATNGSYNQQMSTEELIFCCSDCGNLGCYNGGSTALAWKYFKNHGAVSGGNYNTHDGCKPYQIPPRGILSHFQSPYQMYHECIKQCYGNKSIDYNSDRVKTRDTYSLDINSIQKDVQTYGPVTVAYRVFDDFYSYKNGVYITSKNASPKGWHSVKLIGWGVENDVPYWLLVNSWGYRWGQNGLFKIRRGTNECNIEMHMLGGVPDIG